MTTTATHLHHVALANVAANKSDHVPGFVPNPDATAADFEVGQVVSIFSRGYFRTGVVEKVGRKNVTVLYTTEGAIKEAFDRRDACLAAAVEIDTRLANVRAQAEKNWTYYTSEAVVDQFAADFPNQYPPERIAEEKAKKTAFAAENDHDAWVQAAVDTQRAAIEERAERARSFHPAEWSNFTAKSAAFDKVGVR
jgi:hypothetical protein